ncbi:MAG TPA: glycosyltransferase family 87 protein, partial [Thermoanaerobaculia bacterium]|nr:glycosyltransferase family 87 protein [Thermoanaerobaculia bacterium]
MRRRLLAAAALLYSALHFAAAGIKTPLANFYGDFLAAFPSWGMSLFFGRLDLYTGTLAQKWGPPPVWYYGPLLHAITAPLFAFPSLRSAYIAWLFVNYVFLIAIAVIAIRLVDDAIVVIVVLCNFNPLYEALTQRTIEIVELLLLFAAFALLRRGRERACGAAIGLAATAKFLPLIFLPWLALKRKWDALWAAVLVMLPVVVVTEFVLGWENNGTLRQLFAGGMLKSELDQSLAGFVRRFGASPAVRGAAIAIAAVAFCALMLRVRHNEDTDDLEWGMLLVAMVLLPPHNEDYYFIFLLFPYLTLYARYRRRWSWRAVPTILSWFLVAAPVPF